MLYDATTPDEYLAMLEEDWRKEKLLKIRQMILETAPDTVEGIKYKMLSYGDDQGVFLQLNAQKGYVSLYVGDAGKVDPEGELLKGLNVGKGCVRLSKSVKPEETRIGEFIGKAIEMWKMGQDIDC